MTPAATPPNPQPAGEASSVQDPAFGELLHTALRERARLSTDSRWHLASGLLDPQALCRYAAGRLEAPERTTVEGALARAPWALSRVSALVRGARPEAAGPLAGRIPAAAGAALLADLGHEQADADDPDPLVRAASLLASTRRAEAAAAFPPPEALPSPLARAARQVAHLDDEDEALAHLLDAV